MVAQSFELCESIEIRNFLEVKPYLFGVSLCYATALKSPRWFLKQLNKQRFPVANGRPQE